MKCCSYSSAGFGLFPPSELHRAALEPRRSTGKALPSKQWGMCPFPSLAVFLTRLNVPFPLCFGNILAQPGQTKAQLLQMLSRQRLGRFPHVAAPPLGFSSPFPWYQHMHGKRKSWNESIVHPLICSTSIDPLYIH